MAAPKYWNESIRPEAKPAILRPPMSIGAAGPSIEWVELAVKEISTRKSGSRMVRVDLGRQQDDAVLEEVDAWRPPARAGP